MPDFVSLGRTGGGWNVDVDPGDRMAGGLGDRIVLVGAGPFGFVAFGGRLNLAWSPLRNKLPPGCESPCASPRDCPNWVHSEKNIQVRSRPVFVPHF